MLGLEPRASWSTAGRPDAGKPLNHSVSDAAAEARCTCGCTTTTDPELESLIRAWPALPPAMRRAVLALVDAAGEGGAA
jgi:hypothetical protein